MSKLKEVTLPLETIVVEKVTTRCPIETDIFQGFSIERCQSCAFYLKEKICGWLEYKTKTFDERCDIDDDPYGAMTPNDYYKSIKCALCSSEITFYSSYSSLVKGDKSNCPKCKMPHVFLRTERVGEKWIEVFALPRKKMLR